MVNKQWLIKLTGEDNLFYDSEEKVYRYRNHCPTCGTVSGCQCFKDLETAEEATFEDLDYCCSSKCVLIYNKEEGGVDDIDAIYEAMTTLGIRKGLTELTYQEVLKVIRELDKREAKELLNRLKAGKSINRRELSSYLAREHLGYRVPYTMLMHEDLIKVLQFANTEDLLILENLHDIMVDIGINKKVEDVTEEEAQKILNLCEFDGDAPLGESCNS